MTPAADSSRAEPQNPSVPPTRRPRGQATRARLVASARTLLSGERDEPFTTRHVAALAGVTHGMCHYHFSDRAELVLAVIDDIRPEWITPMQEAVAGPGPFAVRARRVLELLTEPETSGLAHLFSALHWLALSDERVRTALATEYEAWRECFIDLFRVLAAERPDGEIDPETLGAIAAAATDGLAAYEALGIHPASDNALRALLQLPDDAEDEAPARGSAPSPAAPPVAITAPPAG